MLFPSIICASARPNGPTSGPWRPLPAARQVARLRDSHDSGFDGPYRDDGAGSGDARHAGAGTSAYCEIVHSELALLLSGAIDVSNREVLARAGLQLTSRCIATRDDRQASSRSADSAANATTAVIDVAGLTFIDASGVGVLVALRNDLAQAEIGLRTTHPSAQLRRISEICELDDVLGLEPPPAGPRKPDHGSSRASARSAGALV